MECIQCGAEIVATRPGDDPAETIQTCANSHEMVAVTFRANPRPVDEMSSDETASLLDMIAQVAGEGVLWHTTADGERELIGDEKQEPDRVFMELAEALRVGQADRDDGSSFSLAYQDVLVAGKTIMITVKADRASSHDPWWYGTFCYGVRRPFVQVATLAELEPLYAFPVAPDRWYIDEDDDDGQANDAL